MKGSPTSFLLLCALPFGAGLAVAENEKPSTSSAAPPAPRTAAQLTFNKDVAPIIFRHCATCHRPGQAGPFNLLSYADVSKRAKLIAEVVERRYMPPWLPERGVVEFANDPSLTPEQIDIFRRWVAEGAVEGSAPDLPALPKWTEGWQLGSPDLVVKVPQPYTLSAEGKDVYRNLVVPIPVSQRKYVKGVEFQPGNPKVVHHAFVNIDSTPVSRGRAAKETPPGFDGMSLPETVRMPDGHFLGWQPGKRPQFGPEGLAWTLEPNTDLVIQMHLHPSGKPELVQPSVAFYFTQDVPTNSAFRINLNALRIDISPGSKDYTVEDRYTLPIDLAVLGVGPHAHYLGKKIYGYALFSDGARKDLIRINDWDFNWQGEFRYAKPVLLPKGATLVMNWTFDNSADNLRNPNHPPKRVKHGSQTTDEMAELWFQVLPGAPKDRALFERDFYGHLARLAIDYNESLVQENPNNAEAHTKAGRAALYFGQVQKALDHLEAAIRADPNYDKAYYELGFIYMRQSKLREAQQAFENVIRVNPDDYQAQGSLGIISFRNREFDKAEAHFRTALRLNPDDKLANNYLKQVMRAKSAPATQ